MKYKYFGEDLGSLVKNSFFSGEGAQFNFIQI